MRRTISILLLAMALVLTGATAASADEFRCNRSVGSRTLDNVKVPRGATCKLTGTVVKGNIVVGARAVLVADNVRVNGDIQGENSKRIAVRDSRVGGNVQIEQGRRASVVRTVVGGDIQYTDQHGAVVAKRARVDGNIQAFQNSGGVELRRNRVDGNLQCKANSPRPVGGGNIVNGNKEDQCRRL